jgi:phosphatidylglycerophosphate synthase
MTSAGHVHVRINDGWFAAAERRTLIRIARRLPDWVTSDQLTALGWVSLAAAGGGYWAARWHPAFLVLVLVGLAVNWFGDSLDGTLARVRGHERPRYGFYVDHVLDITGIGLLLTGLAVSPFMNPVIALALLAVYLMVSGEVFLATAVQGRFRMSFLKVGPTELRLVLAAGTIALFFRPVVSPFGLGPFRLFDVGGVLAIAGLALALVVSAAGNALDLYRAEPIPRGLGDARPEGRSR